MIVDGGTTRNVAGYAESSVGFSDLLCSAQLHCLNEGQHLSEFTAALKPEAYTPENNLTIYADGSSYSHPRRGGLALRVVTVDVHGDEVVEDVPLVGYESATNNQMELLACVKALEWARDHPRILEFDKVIICTDSRYVTENVARAMFEWSKSRWRNRHSRPVDNAQLWKSLVGLLQKVRRRVEWKWIKGHSFDKHNKAVDKLAKQSAKGHLQRPLSVSSARRKFTTRSVETGSVPMRGQLLSIRIITDSYLRPQHIYKYKYEVLGSEDGSTGNVDWIYSTECLRSAHHYEVIVSRDPAYPQIVEVIRELERG